MKLTVIVGDCIPPICKGPRRLTTESAGSAYVKFIFPGEFWKKLPYRKATFWAGKVVKTVPIIEHSDDLSENDYAFIPEEIFSVTNMPLRVFVCGTDAKPDAAAIARNEEIRVWIQELYKEIPNATDSRNLMTILNEMKVLEAEQSSLNIIRKHCDSDWCEITCIQPGIPSP